MPQSALEIRPVEDPAVAAPRLNRRQAAKIRTRQKVMVAARALFAERGYEPATIRDIARGAGMSTGAVFANFQDKAELFDAVLAEDLERVAAALNEALAAPGDTATRLQAGLSAAYRASYDQLPLVQAVVARAWFQPVAAEKRARETLGPLTGAVAATVEDGVSRGELQRGADVPLLASLIWEGFVSNYRRAAYDGWDAARMSAHLGLQIRAVLAGALAR